MNILKTPLAKKASSIANIIGEHYSTMITTHTSDSVSLSGCRDAGETEEWINVRIVDVGEKYICNFNTHQMMGNTMVNHKELMSFGDFEMLKTFIRQFFQKDEAKSIAKHIKDTQPAAFVALKKGH